MATPRRPVDAGYLRAAIRHYLERWYSPRANIRRLMMTRVRASAAAFGTDPVEGARALDAILDELEAEGVLDDRAYAASRAEKLREKGASSMKMRAQLAQKGLSAAQVDEVVQPEAELGAALTWARKRGLGPFRQGERQEFRARDLAAMGRRGFGWEVARRVIDAENTEELLGRS